MTGEAAWAIRKFGSVLRIAGTYLQWSFRGLNTFNCLINSNKSKTHATSRFSRINPTLPVIFHHGWSTYATAHRQHRSSLLLLFQRREKWSDPPKVYYVSNDSILRSRYVALDLKVVLSSHPSPSDCQKVKF
jgi:hypothetical protein